MLSPEVVSLFEKEIAKAEGVRLESTGMDFEILFSGIDEEGADGLKGLKK